MSIDEDHKLL